MPWQCKVAKGTQVSVGTPAMVEYFSQSLNQLTSSSPEKVRKSNLGLAMERVNELVGVGLGLV
jgi:hypothetical protein